MPFLDPQLGIMSKMRSSLGNLNPRNLTILTYVHHVVGLWRGKIGIYTTGIGINPLRPTVVIAVQMGTTFRTEVTFVTTAS